MWTTLCRTAHQAEKKKMRTLSTLLLAAVPTLVSARVDSTDLNKDQALTALQKINDLKSMDMEVSDHNPPRHPLPAPAALAAPEATLPPPKLPPLTAAPPWECRT